MRAIDLAQLSTRMFKTNPIRTWLTILGVGVGASAVVILVGLGFGLQKIILEETALNEQLLILDVSNHEFLDPVEATIVEKGLKVITLSNTVEEATKISKRLQFVVAAFLSIVLIVSAILIFNTMTIALLQRTKEIGIMRTVGASPFDIKLLFVAESIVIGFWGGLIGSSVGVILGLAINVGLSQLAVNFGIGAVTLFHFPLWLPLSIPWFFAVVGYLTGILPARRAARLNPLETIRYE